jgi:hypothetical protein
VGSNAPALLRRPRRCSHCFGVPSGDALILERYLTYRHRVMLVRFGIRVRVSYNTERGRRRRKLSACGSSISKTHTGFYWFNLGFKKIPNGILALYVIVAVSFLNLFCIGPVLPGPT